MQATRIERENHHGWRNSYRLVNDVLEALVVTDVGPRILELRLRGGANLLQPRDGLGGHGEAEYQFRGGWRLWVAPERRETTYALDNEACQVTVDGPTLRVVAPPQSAAGIRKSVDITLLPGESRLQVRSSIRNVTDRPLTYAAWSLPVLQPGGRAFVPLDVGPPTAFDAVRRLILWSYARVDDPRYAFADDLVTIDHRKIPAGVATDRGRATDESKIGSDSAQGWAAYLLDRTLFLKRFPHDPGGNYADGGSTIEVYSNHEILELEHLGPLTTIGPGEEISLPEDWWVIPDVDIPADTHPRDILQPLIDATPVPLLPVANAAPA